MSEIKKNSVKLQSKSSSKFNNFLGKSVNFWKSNLKVSSQVLAPCCWQNDNTNTDSELLLKTKNQNELPDIPDSIIKQKPAVFQTFKEVYTNNAKIPIEKKKYNDWSKDEDQLLIQLYNNGMNKRWKKISNAFVNKTPRMCGYRIKKLLEFEQDKIKNNNERLQRKGKFKLIKREKKLKMKRKFHKNPNNQVTKENTNEYSNSLNDIFNYQFGSTETSNRLTTPNIDPFQNYEIEMKKKKHSTGKIKDIEMRSNSDKSNNSKDHIHGGFFFNYSRKNSPNLDTPEDKGDFKVAYNKIFVERKTDCDDQNDGKMAEQSEKEKNTDWTEKNENYINLDSIQFRDNRKIDVLDLNSIEGLVKENCEFEEKNILLAKCLIEINNLYKNTNDEEMVKQLMLSQAKILEGMIELTKGARNSIAGSK